MFVCLFCHFRHSSLCLNGKCSYGIKTCLSYINCGDDTFKRFCFLRRHQFETFSSSLIISGKRKILYFNRIKKPKLKYLRKLGNIRFNNRHSVKNVYFDFEKKTISYSKIPCKKKHQIEK